MDAYDEMAAEHHVKLEAEGCKFVYEPANKLIESASHNNGS
jgi:hypothetical protein